MFCHKCGRHLEVGDIFCCNCGVKTNFVEYNENENDEKELIAKYFKRGLQYADILHILHKDHEIVMSLRTFKRRLSQYGLNKSDKTQLQKATGIINSELSQSGPSSEIGYRSMWNRLRTTFGVNIPRDAVMNILRELDPQGCEIRKRRRLVRRVYHSDGPNSTWHTDGYDKLKPYGFPIHGCVDGFSRKILWLKLVKTNNNPLIPANLFLKTIKKIGLRPKNVRTDCGSENGLLAAIQCALSDTLDSHSFGSSHSNQRIENFWSHFRRGYSNWVINFFKDMVSSGVLKLDHSVHMECLWFVFAKFLQRELDIMSEEWNSHQIRASKFSQVAGAPDQLFNYPEIKGYEDQGINVSLLDLDMIKEQLDIEKEAEAALNLEDEDLKEYFLHIIEQTNMSYPPNDWKSAFEVFTKIIERSGC